MRQLSAETVSEIVDGLCCRRQYLKQSADYWNKRLPDSDMPLEEIERCREGWQQWLEKNERAIREVSNQLAPWFKHYATSYPEVADVFEETKPAAPQQGAPQ